MTIDRKLTELLSFLSEDFNITAKKLAEFQNVSERTIRNRLCALNDVLKKNGAEIVSRPHIGSRISVRDSTLYRDFRSKVGFASKSYIPQSFEERYCYLMKHLLTCDGYIKLDDFSEKIFLRKSTITNVLKRAEQVLEKYDLKLERRPYYGIKIVGSEINKRRFIINELIAVYKALFDSDIDAQLKRIADCVIPELEKNGIRIPEITMEDLFIHIYVSILRVRVGFSLNTDISLEKYPNADRIYETSAAFLRRTGQVFGLCFNQHEVQYMSIYLAGKSYLQDEDWRNSTRSIVIPDYIQRLASRMLQTMSDIYMIDMSRNLDLWMSICLHLIPLEIRVRYNIPLRNPLIDEIMQNYMYAFTMASQAVIPLVKTWGYISKDEIGYFALLIAFALEKSKLPRKKKNVLLVCTSGRNSALLLAYRLEKEFSDDIASIEICDRRTLDSKDIRRYDCIFTTIPIEENYPIPVLQLKLFLGFEDIMKARKTLQAGANEVFSRYFREDLFFTDIEADSWRTAISALCQKASDVIMLPSKLEELVCEREELAPTDYGNLIAMPHPICTISDESFVIVGILKKKILWKEKNVQVVLLVSISRTDNTYLQEFYHMVAQLIMSKDKVSILLAEKSFDTFLRLLL